MKKWVLIDIFDAKNNYEFATLMHTIMRNGRDYGMVDAVFEIPSPQPKPKKLNEPPH